MRGRVGKRQAVGEPPCRGDESGPIEKRRQSTTGPLAGGDRASVPLHVLREARVPEAASLDGTHQQRGTFDRPRHPLAGERLDVSGGVADKRHTETGDPARVPRQRPARGQTIENRRLREPQHLGDELLGPAGGDFGSDETGEVDGAVPFANESQVATTDRTHVDAAGTNGSGDRFGRRAKRGREAELATGPRPVRAQRGSRHAASKAIRADDESRLDPMALSAAVVEPHLPEPAVPGTDLGGDAPKRDYFYWELHPGAKAIQAARFENWKAVRNGIDKPVEIYDLSQDAGETQNLASSRPDLVKRAEAILKEAHRPDPNWPLDHRPKEHTESAKKAWEIKRARDKNQWAPENAIARPTGG